MNICITPNSIKLFGSYFKKQIQEQFTNEITGPALLNKMFNEALSNFKNTGLSEARNKELVLQHLSILPQVVKQYMGETPSANNPKLLENMSELSQKVYNASQSDSATDFQDVISELSRLLGSVKLEVPLNIETRFNAISFELFKTANQEMIYEEGVGYKDNVLNPEKEFEFSVLRNIIATQNAGEVKLKLVTQGSLKNSKSVVNTLNNANLDLYVLVPITSDGELARFDKAGKLVKDGSTPVFSFKQNSSEFDYFRKEKTSLYIDQGNSEIEAKQLVENEIAGFIDIVNGLIAKDKAGETATIELDMKSSSIGMVEMNLHKPTAMSEISNVDSLNLFVETSGKRWYPAIHIPSSAKGEGVVKTVELLQNSLADITDAELDVLVELLVNRNLKIAGEKTTINRATRKELIYYFHQEIKTGQVGFKFHYDEGSVKDEVTGKFKRHYRLNINGKVLDLLNDDVEIVRNTIKEEFSKKEEGIYRHSTDFTNLTPFSSFEATTGINQIYLKADGSYGITTGARRNMNVKPNSDLSATFDFAQAIENGIITLGQKTHKSHIIENSKTTVVPNSNKEIRGYSAYLGLKPTLDEISDIDFSQDEEIFFSSAGSNNLRTQPTESQLKKADEWTKNNPLVKVLGVNFIDQLHEKGPSFIAEYVKSSINLYLGSNKTDIYHEAFHAFTQAILSKAERDALYKELRTTPGSFKVTVHGKTKTVDFVSASDLELEEYLAERFQEFAMSKGKNSNKFSTRIGQFFEKIWNMLQGIFGKNMTYNEAVALNKSNSVVNSMFNALYEGNIDLSKFNPQASSVALYKSSEINVEGVDFSLEEINLTMESMNSLMSDFINQGLNVTTNIETKRNLVGKLLKLSTVKLNSAEHKKLSNEIEKINNSSGTANGYGVFDVSTNPALLKYAIRYIQNRLIQQRNFLKPAKGEKPGFGYVTLTKAIDNFGSLENISDYLELNDNSNILSLYLNKYSTINKLNLELDATDEMNDEERMMFLFGQTGTEQSLSEITDDQTKQLLSSIHAYSNNGKGSVQVNSVGIKKLQPFEQMLAKTAKILRNTSDRVEMYNKLKIAAQKDFEIKQILLKLGDITSSKITIQEQKQWLGFWQVMNKSDLLLREFIFEKKETKDKEVSYESRSGRSKSQINRIGNDWGDNYIFVSQTNKYYKYDSAKGSGYLDLSDAKIGKELSFLAEYGQKGYGLISGTGPSFITNRSEIKGDAVYSKNLMYKAAALPFEFLSHLGIELVEDEIVRDILFNGSSALGINSGVVVNIYESLANRASAIKESDKKVFALKDFFSKKFNYKLNGETLVQSETNGYFSQLQSLQFMFSDDVSSFMGVNAKGDKQSEKSFNSSLTIMINLLNNAKDYNELINTPGMEMFNVENNPFAAASPWLINMFNLESQDPSIKFTRQPGTNISIENLSGSKIIYGSEDKGISAIGSDEKTKLISDFHLTLEGKQEILRSEAKATSLTVYAPVKRNSNFSKTSLDFTKEDVEKIFSEEYDNNQKSTILYNQFYRHLEAELVRITRLNFVAEEIENGKDVVFDVAYLNRGRDFYMFDEILKNDPALKQQLLNLEIDESFTLNGLLEPNTKKKIDLALKKYFAYKSESLFNEKNEQLTISDNAFSLFANKDETVDQTRKKMFNAFVLNNFIQNANYSTLFIGDSALYKVEGEDYHKRIAGLISTGNIFAVDSSFLNFVNTPEFKNYGFAKKHNGAEYSRDYTGYLNTGVIAEKETASVYLEQFRDVIGLDVNDYGGKDKMKEADGAGWISFDAYRLMNLSSNEWSDAQEHIYQKMLAGEKLEASDIKSTFPVRKFQYYGPVTNGSANYGLQMMAFHKYSLMPLIPGLIENTPLQKLHEQMMEQGLDYITMQSGSKVSSLSKVEKVEGREEYKSVFDNVYDQERNLNSITFTVNQINTKYLKNQNFIASGYKGKITLPTQKRKMIVLGLMDNFAPVDFMADSTNEIRKQKWDAIKSESKKRSLSKNYEWYSKYQEVLSKLNAHLKNELLEEIGLKLVNGKYVGDSSKLVSYLQGQMKNNDLLPGDIEFITTPDGKLKSDLSLSMYSEKIESILITLADKKLRALKVTGEALVQVPGTMFENSTAASNFQKLENPSAKDIYNYGSNGLKFYHVVDENNDPVLNKNKNWIVKSMEVKISLQNDFKKLLYLKHIDGKKIAVYSKNEEGKNQLDLEASRLRLNECIKNEEWNSEHSKFLQIAGDRIPSQGPNALESITVAEFLPEWAGPIVILPAEIVAKAGSDYDIDKLFTQFPNIVKIGNKIELQQYIENVKESIEELYFAKEKYSEKIKSVQKTIDELYEDKNTFWNESTKISEDIKEQIRQEQDLEKDLYKTKSELAGYLNAAENGIWKFKGLAYKERQKFIGQYTEKLEEINSLIDIQEEEIKKIMFEKLGAEIASDFYNYKQSLIDEQKNIKKNIQASIDEIQRKIYGKSIKGLENEMLSLFTERILFPGNIKDLVTSNSTNVALPIAEAIEKKLNDSNIKNSYSKYERIDGTRGTKIAKTTIYDYRYNLLKHQENSVGLDSLGIAAVTATFYAVFTTFGAKLNAASPKEQTAFNSALEVLNNTSSTQKQLESAEKIINKFKNHTFNIDHNSVVGEYGKQVALGFTKNIKGQSISDLLSQLINGYVDVAKNAWIFNIQGNKENTPNLLFMVMAGATLESAAYLSASPLVMQYNQIKKELTGVYSLLTNEAGVNPVVESTRILKTAQTKLFEIHQELFNAEGYNKAAFNSISNRNQQEFSESELFEMIGNSDLNLRHLEALAEYIQIEKMANDVSKFQQLTRFDTSKVASISEAQKRLDDIENYKSQNTYTPNSWFDSQGIGNSPIGSFNNDKFIVELFERYFSFRNNPAVIKASLLLDNTKGIIPTVMRNDFKNDFLFFLYQNSLYEKNKYSGYELKLNSDDNAPMVIDEESKVITYGKNIMFNDIQNPLSGMQNVAVNFSTLDQYLRYKIEFEKLNTLNVADLREEYYYLDNAKDAYTDLYLKQKIALYNASNHNAYFNGPTSIVNILKAFKLKYPDLEKEFSLIRDIRYDYDVVNIKNNMFLPNINDPKLRAQYKENLDNLKNHSSAEVRNFFNKFDHIAMMQTGLNRRSKYDLGKLITETHLEEVIQNGIGISRVENELDQVLNNINDAEKNNRNPLNARVEPNLQLLGQFKDLFQNMIETKYKIRTKGYNYEVQNLNWGVSKNKSETILAFNNVEIRTSFAGMDKNLVGITADSFFDVDKEYTPEEFANELEGKKIAILNQKLVVPTGENQKKFDKLLMDRFGIDNTKEFPSLDYKSKTKNKNNLSIAGLGTSLKPIHSVKDEAMANASTIAIGKATVLNPGYTSSSKMYTEELTKTDVSKLATTKTKFKSTDSVWVFGSGEFKNAYRNTTIEEFQKALIETFNSYHKPLIEKAIASGVSIFNVGTASGIDEKTVKLLEENGFIKVQMYAAVGKYYQMRKLNSDFSDLNYDIKSEIVKASDLDAKDLVGVIFDSNKSENWFNDLGEKELFENGVAVVYDKLVRALNKNQKYKINFANKLVASVGPISIGNSLLASYVEQAMYKMKEDIVAHRKSKEKSPIVVNQLNDDTNSILSGELYKAYKGTLSKDEFLSLPLKEQVEIIDHQENC